MDSRKIPLKTKIIAPDGKEIEVFPYSISKVNITKKVPTVDNAAADPDDIGADLKIDSEIPTEHYTEEINLVDKDKNHYGYLSYQTSDNDIYILRMSASLKGYQHIGTALLEFVFEESQRIGKGGHLSVETEHNSHIFFYINGFRVDPKKEDELEFNLGVGAPAEMVKLGNSYLMEKNPAKRTALEPLLLTALKTNNLGGDISYYDVSVKLATRVLGRAPQNTDEIIRHGMFVDKTEKMEAQYQTAKKSGARVEQVRFDLSSEAHRMYLPDDIIAAKIKHGWNATKPKLKTSAISPPTATVVSSETKTTAMLYSLSKTHLAAAPTALPPVTQPKPASTSSTTAADPKSSQVTTPTAAAKK